MQLTINLPESQDLIRLPGGTIHWTEDDFFDFCRANRDLRIERNSKGEVLIMSPSGSYSSHMCADVVFQLKLWAVKDGRGIVFESSGGFRLPNGAMRAPPPGF